LPADAAGTGIASASRGSVLHVLAVFLRLGCTSFGGPIAHLGYFHAELVRRRCWLDQATYSDIVALCQFLPGPASSRPRWRSACCVPAWQEGSLHGSALRCPPRC
jgi:hypothetical protein